MNKKILLLFSAILVVVAMSAYETLYPTGAPAGYTGSPGDGNNCTSCHGGTATTSLGWITSNIPGTGYIPGTTYQITATNSLSGSGKYGFEVSPQNAAGNLLGTLTAGTGSQLVGSGKYVTHSNATLVNNSWTFSWTAPTAGTGSVTFYGAFARGKPGPVTLSTLVVNEALSAPAAAGPITGPSTACASSSKNYSVGAIAGATSYVWSVPAGATITSGQGTTAIAVNFGAAAVSGNVSVYGTNTAGNGASSNLSVAVSNVPSITATPTGLVSVDILTTSQTEYTTTGATGASSYQWEMLPAEAGSIIGAGLTATVTWSNYTGVVTIKSKAMNNCGEGAWSNELQVSVYNSVGVSNPEKTLSFSAFPSPSNGNFTVSLSGFSQSVTLRVLDLSGREVARRSVNGNEETPLNLNLAHGVYVLVAEDGTRVTKQKMVVE